MPELLAVVYENGKDSGAILATLEQLKRDNAITIIEEDFSQRVCGALSSTGSLVMFIAQDGDPVLREMRRHGGVVVRAHLPEGFGLRDRALGGTSTTNPQMAGQRRAESGGESTEESGQ